ncbi:hypothetical protein EG240_14655 [Paenimyroides tangerinum]|uniref:Uncharacterized protein n=1 Tax=Paenimyroides tangerinum TaxID=2488728 RepID=A0A3P3VYY7_9FLAO|nr:hypothetical protein [Paenimyroides tangerinum]RRJ87704.1 hypothetical protein EG240_14655 [Paenimyroides tangerinum]
MLHRLLLLTLMLFCTTSLFAQNTIEETTLDELEIASKRKRKIKKYKIDGINPEFQVLSKDNFFITKYDNLPKGKIISATFYFNTWAPNLLNSINDDFKTNYKDVDLGILVYEMKKDGTLGKMISDSEVNFTVKKEHRGELKIDVSEIDFPTGDFFMGIKVLSECNADEGNFFIRICETDKTFSYETFLSKANAKDKSITLAQQPFALKTTLEIEQ